MCMKAWGRFFHQKLERLDSSFLILFWTIFLDLKSKFYKNCPQMVYEQYQQFEIYGLDFKYFNIVSNT